jgi:hypothetical protein
MTFRRAGCGGEAIRESSSPISPLPGISDVVNSASRDALPGFVKLESRRAGVEPRPRQHSTAVQRPNLGLASETPLPSSKAFGQVSCQPTRGMPIHLAVSYGEGLVMGSTLLRRPKA